MQKMTRKSDIAMMMNYYSRYQRSNAAELYQVYGSYSRKKQAALDYCKELQLKYNGFNGKIIGFNSHFFSYGFEFTDAGTGVLCFAFITREHNRYCEV